MNMTFTLTLIAYNKDNNEAPLPSVFLLMKPNSFRHLVDIATVWTVVCVVR